MKLALPPSAPRETRAWSPQQEAIFSAVGPRERGNLLVEAVAGSGKTTTLVEAAARMQGSVAFCAYNKKIADEIKFRVQNFGNVQAGTFHSFGFAAWRSYLGTAKLKVESGKLRILASQLGQGWELRKFTTQAAGLAKQALLRAEASADEDFAQLYDWHDTWDELDPEFTRDEGIAGVRELLRASVAESHRMIDFDDMLYMPLLNEAQFPTFDWVLIDEAQDSNFVRRAVAMRMLKPSGRLMAVGDRHQAIYGFTGADSAALDIIQNMFGCKQLPLTVSYRCPQAVVRHAQNYVDHIQAAPNAIEGSVQQIDQKTFWKGVKDLKRADAILCRNTRPLVDLAFELIRNDIGCHVEGREIGESLIRLIEKYPKVKNLNELRKSLEIFMRLECDRLIDKGQEAAAAGIEDRVLTLVAVIESMDGDAAPMALKLKLSALFGDTTPGEESPSLTLATIHKSKGREWDRVYIWGANKYQPSPYATKDWQKEQENNLRYVSITRAKKELIEVSV